MTRKSNSYNAIESILGYDMSAKRLLGESWQDELLDAYRDLLSTAKRSASFDELVDAIVDFLEALEDGDDEGGGKVEAAFGALLRNQMMSDELRDQVSSLVHESLRRPHLDGRFVCESMEGLEGIQDRIYKDVKMARSFEEAAKTVQGFCDQIKTLNPEMGHEIEECMIQGVLATMESPEFKKKIKMLAKADAEAAED